MARRVPAIPRRRADPCAGPAAPERVDRPAYSRLLQRNLGVLPVAEVIRYFRGVRLNGLGVAMYVLMTGWLLLASTARLMIELGTGNLDFLPFVGVALGLLALAGIGFGRVTDRD